MLSFMLVSLGTLYGDGIGVSGDFTGVHGESGAIHSGFCVLFFWMFPCCCEKFHSYQPSFITSLQSVNVFIELLGSYIV